MLVMEVITYLVTLLLLALEGILGLKQIISNFWTQNRNVLMSSFGFI